MSNFKPSRRAVLSGGAVAAAATALPVSGLAATEIEAARKMVGTNYAVAGRTAVLEEIVELSPKVRPPMSVVHRTPYAAVFRLNGEAPLAGDTYGFSVDGLTEEPLLVTSFTGSDGVHRLEAIFN